MAWGTYADGTHTLNSTPARFSLLQIVVGQNGMYTRLAVMGQAGDIIKINTEQGWVTLTWGNGTITVAGTTATTRLREIKEYPGFRLSL